MNAIPSKRDQILDAALELFATRGFHGTAVPDLARSAGVGAGTIYRYFDNKEALVNVLFRRWKTQMVAEVFEAPFEGSWRQRLRALWRALFSFHEAHPHAIPFLDLHHHSGYLDDESRQVELMSAMRWLEMISQGQQDDALVDMNPAAVIAMSYGAFLGLVRGANSQYYVLDETMLNQTEERVWAMIRR